MYISLKQDDRLKPDFLCSRLGIWERNYGPGHMTKTAVMPIHGKNIKQSSSPEPDVNDLEMWYLASGSGVLQNLFK